MYGFGMLMLRPSRHPQQMTWPLPLQVPQFPEDVANLLDQVNKKVLVLLRDGKTMIGTLVTVDQFSNITLIDTVERVFAGKQFSDIQRGIIIIRGDNLALLGEFNEEQNNSLQEVSFDEILAAQKQYSEELELREQKRIEGFKDRGLRYIPRHNNQDTTFRLGEDQFNYDW